MTTPTQEARIPIDLAALVAVATHVTERHDVVIGTSDGPKVTWECREDCPVCRAKNLLADQGLL
jgi:hypothetical protein